MKYIYILLVVLIALLALVLLAAVTPQVENATGVLHPEFPGMFISPANIDQAVHTRWIGYLFGLGIIFLFGIMLFIGNRKKGKLTSIGPWLYVGLLVYMLAYSMMVFSHWDYTLNHDSSFFLSMPKPTAWMIYVVWFVPLVITIAFIVKFESAIISDEEIDEFQDYLTDSSKRIG